MFCKNSTRREILLKFRYPMGAKAISSLSTPKSLMRFPDQGYHPGPISNRRLISSWGAHICGAGPPEKESIAVDSPRWYTILTAWNYPGMLPNRYEAESKFLWMRTYLNYSPEIYCSLVIKEKMDKRIGSLTWAFILGVGV